MMASSKPKPVYLIDSSIYFFRAWFALPDAWFSPDGYSVNAVYGYARFLIDLLDRVRPEYIVAAFDESLGSCFRNDIYPPYKASRAYPDESLAFQLAACQSLTELFGVVSITSEKYEADDIIATLQTTAEKAGHATCILSRDKDLGQLLLNDGDTLWDYSADRRITRSNFIDHFGVMPEQVVDYLALVGDSVDDVPGVPGIGKKTAAALLEKYDSVDALYGNLSTLSESGLRGARKLESRLVDYHEQVRMAQQLITLFRQVPLNCQLDELCWKAPSREVLNCFFDEIGLPSALKRQLDNCEWCD